VEMGKRQSLIPVGLRYVDEDNFFYRDEYEIKG